MAAAVGPHLANLLSQLDAQLSECQQECDASAAQHSAWLAETVQTNTKQLQYHTCAPTLAAPPCACALSAPPPPSRR